MTVAAEETRVIRLFQRAERLDAAGPLRLLVHQRTVARLAGPRRSCVRRADKFLEGCDS